MKKDLPLLIALLAVVIILVLLKLAMTHYGDGLAFGIFSSIAEIITGIFLVKKVTSFLRNNLQNKGHSEKKINAYVYSIWIISAILIFITLQVWEMFLWKIL